MSRFALMLAAGLLLSGCNFSASDGSALSGSGSLKDRESHFAPSASAPESRFAPAALPEGGFRLSEVDSALRDQTQGLLTELKARELPDQSIVIDLPADILFDFDKADLRPDAFPALEKAAKLLASYPRAPLAVYGHTDAKGEDAYNDPLSLRRAEAVAAWLREKSGRSAEVSGFGEKKPVAANSKPDGSDDPDGRQKNRRVEIVIKPAPVAAAPAGSATPAPSGPTAASESSFGAAAKE